jgi:hypothetical protein
VESPRRLLEREAVLVPFAEWVANAECEACLAQYLAWMDDREQPLGKREQLPKPRDLSFRYSLRNEPNERDLPRYRVEARLVRVGLYEHAVYHRLGVVGEPLLPPSPPAEAEAEVLHPGHYWLFRDGARVRHEWKLALGVSRCVQCGHYRARPGDYERGVAGLEQRHPEFCIVVTGKEE